MAAPLINVAVVGLAVPGLRVLFDGAWFSAAIGSAVVYRALMRGADTAPARTS